VEQEFSDSNAHMRAAKPAVSSAFAELAVFRRPPYEGRPTARSYALVVAQRGSFTVVASTNGGEPRATGHPV
jgi:hypothetical protein